MLSPIVEDRRSSCFVYIIGISGRDRPIKIGMATDLLARLKGIQVFHYKELEIKAGHLLHSVAMAKEVEALAHAALSDSRIRGEWFNVAAADAAAALLKQIPDGYEVGYKRQVGNRWESVPSGTARCMSTPDEPTGGYPAH